MKFFIMCLFSIAAAACFTILPPGRWLARKYQRWYTSHPSKILHFLGHPRALFILAILCVLFLSSTLKPSTPKLFEVISFIVIFLLTIIACAAAQTWKEEKQNTGKDATPPTRE